MTDDVIGMLYGWAANAARRWPACRENQKTFVILREPFGGCAGYFMRSIFFSSRTGLDFKRLSEHFTQKAAFLRRPRKELVMSYPFDRVQRLGRLADQLRVAECPSAALLSSIGNECSRMSASRQSSMSVQISRLVSMGAWTDAALSLMESELPLWKLRRLAYDNGRWHCAISRQRELPDWLDQAVEANHQNLSLAVLTVLVEALLENSASRQFNVPAIRVMDERYEALDCGNFA